MNNSHHCTREQLKRAIGGEEKHSVYATTLRGVGLGCGGTRTGGELEEAIVACQRKMYFGATKIKLFEVLDSENLISPTQI